MIFEVEGQMENLGADFINVNKDMLGLSNISIYFMVS